MCDSPVKVPRRDEFGEPVKYRDPRSGVGYQDVPCRKCLPCIRRRCNDWVIRLREELKISSSAFFLTLTYSDENLPHGTFQPTLHRPDLTKFFRKLRKKNPKQKIKYYACGEYGSKTKRPHYHAILFNGDPQTFQSAWSREVGKHSDGQSIVAPIGHVHVGNVSEASIAYVTKYVEKWDPEYCKKQEIQQEFSVMSKHLGGSYLTKKKKAWHRNKEALLDRVYYWHSGVKFPLPKYYKEKIYNQEELEFINQHLKNSIYEKLREDYRNYQRRILLRNRNSFGRKRSFEDLQNSKKRARAIKLRKSANSRKN